MDTLCTVFIFEHLVYADTDSIYAYVTVLYHISQYRAIRTSIYRYYQSI